jgi:hypothetical protein
MQLRQAGFFGMRAEVSLETEIHHEGHEDKMLEKKGLSEFSDPWGSNPVGELFAGLLSSASSTSL